MEKLNLSGKKEITEMKLSIIIFNEFPFIDKKFEISFLPYENNIFYQKNLEQKNYKIDYFKDNLLFFLFKNAYQINLKTKQIINIYELDSTEIIDKHDHLYYQIKDTEYKRIEQCELKENSFHNENKIIKEYNLLEFHTYKNFKDKLHIYKNGKDIITCIDLKEERIIEFLKINLKLNGNEIIIHFENKNIKFYSILDSNIYKLILPDNIVN